MAVVEGRTLETVAWSLPRAMPFLSFLLLLLLQRRIQAMEMRCYRKTLHISYKDHVTNEKVRAKIQQAIGPHEDLTIAET